MGRCSESYSGALWHELMTMITITRRNKARTISGRKETVGRRKRTIAETCTGTWGTYTYKGGRRNPAEEEYTDEKNDGVSGI